MSATLSANQKRYLRGLAHPLKPVILMGAKGLTDSLLAELDLALEHHELVKVRITAEDREARDALVAELAQRANAQLVQRIGNIACLYRRNQEAPQIPLPR
ncbi:ribosome assembly RNA-binding protein YhbY [Xanthomonadaceae bacterium JHOS43]|nr:ribosome assembly RNA-binding protein YhbY [Xanthomonadaceae bacterium JHOS43]MCX7563964.1 ribosome assembly RNA-binding protein YhbY [Xanthomonadaceae bacterium XH05]